ncbi:MAG: YggU family protein [Candidatus Competibacteraceae bacterium]|nr:YggU family protein [Candidatus Competibacteraceae bacterium]
MNSYYRWDGSDLILRVRIQPRASRDEWLDPQQEHLRLRISAPPVAGQANSRSRDFIAKAFQVPPSRVVLISGETSRNKRFRIHSPRRLPPDIKPAPNT